MVWVCLLLVLAVVAVFGQTAGFEFVNYDDPANVYENSVVQKGLSGQAVVWAFTHRQIGNWIPLTTLSHVLDCQLFGLRSGAHHLVNVLWHTANAVLLFLVLRQMTGSLWRSAFVAAVFAVHPLRAESVAWISERKDVLSGSFFMLTIGAYVRQVRQPSRAGYVAVVLLFACGLLAKSMVATLPFVLLLLDYWPLGRLHNARQLVGLFREKIPLVALSAGACVAAALMFGPLVRNRLPIFERIGNALVSYVVYLWQMIFPAGLAAHYPVAPDGQPIWLVCLAFVLLAAISALLVAWREECPYLLMGWLWYLGMLLPVIGIVQISSDAAHADRYTYLPEIGLALAVTWAVADLSALWKNRRMVLGALMVAVTGALIVWGHHQTSYWRNDESLWTRALDCTSGDSVAHNNLGTTLSKSGKLGFAVEQFRKALQIKPDYPDALRNLGVAFFDTGRKEEAIAQYRKALELKPDYVEARRDLGIALFDTGRKEEAIAQYRKALELKPDYVEARNNLGIALRQNGDLDGAVAQYQKILEIKPDDAEARNNLGNALGIKGDLEGATVQYRKVLQIHPSYAAVHNNLGNALGMEGDLEGAVAQFRKALELNPDYAEAHYDLGAAFVKIGKLDEAIAHYRKALQLNPGYVKARRSLGKALLRKGDFDGAMACFEKVAALSPDPLGRWLNLGGNLLQERDLEEAIACYQQAIRIDPHCADAHSHAGLAYFQKGDIKEAINSWQQALAAKPDQADVQNNLAWLLATAPDASLRQGAKAVALAERANQLNGSTNAAVLHTLAAAYAETGRYQDAATTARRALAVAVEQKNGDLTVTLPREIKLYETDRPMRDVPQ